MDPDDSMLDILSKEPFICLKRIDNISPRNSFNYVKHARKDPVIILDDIGNKNFDLPLSSINDLSGINIKSSFMKKIENIEKQEINERVKKIVSQQNENLSDKVEIIEQQESNERVIEIVSQQNENLSKKEENIEKQETNERVIEIVSQQSENLSENVENIEKHETNESVIELDSRQNENFSEKVKFTIGNNDITPTFRREFSPLITDSNISNAKISSEAHVKLDEKDLLKNMRDNIDYAAAITNRNNNFDSLTLKKICVKFKATVHLVRLSQNLRTNNCIPEKSTTKNICKLDHNKFKRCLFNTKVCNSNFLKEKTLTNYKSNGHTLEVANNIFNEKSENSVARIHGAKVNDFNIGHSNSQNVSKGCKRPAVDNIPNNDLKRIRHNDEKTNFYEIESDLVIEKKSPIKHVAPLDDVFSNHRTMPSMLDNNIKSIITNRSVELKQAFTNKIHTSSPKKVRFADETVIIRDKYDLKRSNTVKPFIDKIPRIVLKRIKINTTESKKIKHEISKMNYAKTNGFLVSDTKMPNNAKNMIPNIFVPCKQPFISRNPVVNLKTLRIIDNVNSDERLKVMKHSNQINSQVIAPKQNKTVYKYQEGKEKYCKEVRVVIKRLKGEWIKKHLSMLSYPRNIKNCGNIHMQKSSSSLQKTNSKLQCYSPTKNSLMSSVLQYSIDHTNILINLKQKSCKKNQNSSIFSKKKNPGRNGNGLNIAFKVFCTLQLSYNIHKVNALLTRF